MQFNAAVIRDHGVNFAVVIVKPSVLRSPQEAVKAQVAFAPAFRGIPVVLMAQDNQGTPSFHGRQDLIGLLSDVNLDNVPWKVYSYGR
jgi:hypothetical protein